MQHEPLTLSCALVLLSGAGGAGSRGEAAVATAGGVFAVSLEPQRLVSELKEAIKRKKPHDLRHVDADALSLFLALDGAQWLSDEHDAALTLEIRGSPVHEAVVDMLEYSGGVLRATKPLHRYFLEGNLPPPAAEQIHLIVAAPSAPVGKRKLGAQEAAANQRATKPKHAHSDGDYVDIVHVLDSDDERASDYVEPPRPIRNEEELYRRLGKEYPSSGSPLLQRTTDQPRPRLQMDTAFTTRPASRTVLPDQISALLQSRYVYRPASAPTNSSTHASASSGRARNAVSPSTARWGSSAARPIELMEVDSVGTASSTDSSSLWGLALAQPVGTSAGGAQVSPPGEHALSPSLRHSQRSVASSSHDVKPDVSTPTTEVESAAAMFARLSQFDSEPSASSSHWATIPSSQSYGTPSASQSGPETDASPSQPLEPPIVFSEEQNKFINLAVEKRRNLLLVAPAGYGKSAVIKTIIQLFDSSLPSVNDAPVCGLCAPTGKAASLIGGRTLHSYLGIGIGRGSVDDWVKRVRSASFLKPTLKALRAVQVILIDEISMVSAQFLDRISEYLQRIRGNAQPFGGVQMILVGDLCQLPPVEGAFMFRSLEFARAEFQSYQFTKCFRQNDPEFVALLNEVRYARCSEQTLSTLRKCTSIAPEYANGLSPMRIVSTNKEVDTINERELFSLTYDSKADVLTYSVRVSPFANPKKADAYRKADGIPEYVKLAVGCQVVVTQNLGQGLVNGTQGCVTAADAKKIELRLQDGNAATIEYFAYKDPEQPDVFVATTLFSYLPVRLGYASTVHKAQGMTLQLLEVDLKRTFAHGQLYTALSRVTDLRGLVVKNLTQRAFICSEAVLDFYRQLGDGAGDGVRV